MRRTGKRVRLQDRAHPLSSRVPHIFLSAQSGSIHRGNTKSMKTRNPSSVFPTSTLLCPPVEGVSLITALITPPGDVGMTAPRETRVGGCKIGEGTSDTPTYAMLDFDVKTSGSMTPANATIVGMTAPGESRIGVLNTPAHVTTMYLRTSRVLETTVLPMINGVWSNTAVGLRPATPPMDPEDGDSGDGGEYCGDGGNGDDAEDSGVVSAEESSSGGSKGTTVEDEEDGGKLLLGIRSFGCRSSGRASRESNGDDLTSPMQEQQWLLC